jgi:Tol biopolymer transport system component
MKRIKANHLVLIVIVVLTSCTSNNSVRKIDINQDKPRLTENEIQQARLTPEILWKFGRIGGAVLSPSGDKVLYTVTYYQLKQDKGNTSLYIMNSDGSDLVRLTDTTGSESNPRFRPLEERIGFISNRTGSSQLWEMNRNGSNLKQITNIVGGINSFEYSPDGSKIFYTHNVKLDTAASEIYPDLPKANFFVTRTLMYRHWNKWRDYTYSHVFYASLDSARINGGIDIMKGEKEDSPLPPYF